MSYVDKYGLMNVKPVGLALEPSGNDGWIITAYASKSGYPFYWKEIKNQKDTWYSILGGDSFPKVRFPGKTTPPPSRDMFLGLCHLAEIDAYDLEERGWNFSPWGLPEFNLIDLVKQLWALRGKHRNTFWEQPGFEQVYHVAFMIPLQDRGYYYRRWGLRPPLIYRWIEVIDSILRPKTDSSKLIHWLKYDKKPEREVFERYFGKDHPITKAAVDGQK